MNEVVKTLHIRMAKEIYKTVSSSLENYKKIYL
jgi:hypothetical protein